MRRKSSCRARSTHVEIQTMPSVGTLTPDQFCEVTATGGSVGTTTMEVYIYRRPQHFAPPFAAITTRRYLPERVLHGSLSFKNRCIHCLLLFSFIFFPTGFQCECLQCRPTLSQETRTRTRTDLPILGAREVALSYRAPSCFGLPKKKFC